MPNGLRIEHLCDIIPKAQSWLVLNLPVSMFVYIHFNVPPTTITDLVRNVSDEKIYARGRNLPEQISIRGKIVGSARKCRNVVV